MEMKVVHWWKEGWKLVGGWVVNESGSLVEVRCVGGIITKKEMKVFEEERWMLVSGWEMKVVHWWKEGLKLVGGWVVNEGGSLVEVRWVGGIITKKEIKVGDW